MLADPIDPYVQSLIEGFYDLNLVKGTAEYSKAFADLTNLLCDHYKRLNQ